MKTIIFGFVIGLLTISSGCGKNDSFSPRIDAPFNQPLTLRDQQSAMLPSQAAPELTVKIDSIVEHRCPEGVNCFQPGEVQTLLTVQDRNGVNQRVGLELTGLSSRIDSIKLQANSRTYTLVLESVTPYPKLSGDTDKEGKRVVLTVRRR